LSSFLNTLTKHNMKQKKSKTHKLASGVTKITDVTNNTKEAQSVKRIYRSKDERMLGGVCGGIAKYLNADPTAIRLLFVLLVCAGGSGILLYLLAWLIIPEEKKERTRA